MTAQKFPVYLRIYDLTHGQASVWSPLLLFKKLEGIWHTGIQVYGFEYFYGGGVLKLYPHDFEEYFNMKPVEVLHLGYTSMSQAEFERFLDEISCDFCPSTYDLIKWNCNNFSNTCAKYLLDKGIPEEITELPSEINRTFMGGIIIKAMKAMRGTPPVGADQMAHTSQKVDRTRHRCKSVASTRTAPLPEYHSRPRRYTCPSVRNYDPATHKARTPTHGSTANHQPPAPRYGTIRS